MNFLFPLSAFAVDATTTDMTQLKSILSVVGGVFNFAIPILITLGVIYFIWAVTRYVTIRDEEERAKSKGHIIYGLIGLFVAVSIWGIIQLLNTTLGINAGGTTVLPCSTDEDNNPYNGCQ